MTFYDNNCAQDHSLMHIVGRNMMIIFVIVIFFLDTPSWQQAISYCWAINVCHNAIHSHKKLHSIKMLNFMAYNLSYFCWVSKRNYLPQFSQWRRCIKDWAFMLFKWLQIFYISPLCENIHRLMDFHIARGFAVSKSGSLWWWKLKR